MRYLALAGLLMISSTGHAASTQPEKRLNAPAPQRAPVVRKSWSGAGERMGPGAIAGNPHGAANEHQPPCGASSPEGSDLTFRWAPPATGNYVFTVDANFEPILYFYDRLDSNQQVLGCSNDKSSRMVINLQAHKEIFIVVDTATSPSASSEFSLNICNPALCSTPPDAKGCFQAGTCSFGGACEYSPQPAGTGCNDQDACTEKDACNGSGVCTGTKCVAPANASVICGGAAGCDFKCNSGYTRNGNACEVEVCQPQCDGKQCGPDGCGGTCGRCSTGNVCNNEGTCVSIRVRPPKEIPVDKPKRPGDIREPIPRDRPKALEPNPRIQPK